jgi:DNA-binding NarL/FixJ family response regulator
VTITIFLADDHPIVRDGLRALLDLQADLRVVGSAGDGREAVRLVKQLQPDIVVMDIAMSQLNGLEATQQIAETSAATQVIILSMHASDDQIHRALKAGARGYLLKDSAGEDVVAAIRAVHAGRYFLSQAISTAIIDDYLRLPHPANPFDSLSQREREVVQLTVEGKTSAEIAGTLSLSARTVETYRARAMRKLGLNDLPELVKLALRHGLTQLE